VTDALSGGPANENTAANVRETIDEAHQAAANLASDTEDVVPRSGGDPAERAAAELRDAVAAAAQAKAFETGVPTVHVVLLPHASHYVFRSNEGDVLREMNAFLRVLKH
jgi:hypothetical protein